MAEAITWHDAVDEFCDRKSGAWEPSTVHWYRGQMRLLADWAVGANVALGEFKRRHMERYMAERRLRVAANTVRKDADCACVFTRFWTAEGVFERDPLAELEKPKREKPHVAPPKERELDALLAAVQDKHGDARHACNHMTKNQRSYLKARDTAVILTLCETGLRIGELCRLTLDDCDLDADTQSTITVRKTKSKKARSFPISPELRQHLSNWLLTRKRQALTTTAMFPTLYDEPITRDGMHKQIDRYWLAAGIAPKTLHALRHYAAKWLTRKGSITSAQKVLGHSDIRTTAMYAELDEDEIREDVNTAGVVRRLMEQRSKRRSRPERKMMVR